MEGEQSRKVVRSFRLVFRRRWRIFRIQGWRIPLPGGLELRALGYWLLCLAVIGLLGELPLLGAALGALPPALRLLIAPALGAWALSRWEPDGRSPHRALAGLARWRLRPRCLAALRACPPDGAPVAPLPPLVVASELRGARLPRGRLRGPARLLLRYPVEARVSPWRRSQPVRASRWRLRQAGAEPLRRGIEIEVPAGRVVIFE